MHRSTLRVASLTAASCALDFRGCSCQLTTPTEVIQSSGPWSVEGDTLFDGVSNDPFCVSGDTLQIQSGSGSLTGVTTYRRAD